MPPIVFSHGNGFPASTYRVLLEALRECGFAVHSIEKFGHDAAYPVTDNWPHLVRQLADFTKPIAAAAPRGKVFLVGHSLGGFLSLMCAARHPELASGVVLLDSPLIGGWRAAGLGLVKRTPLMKSVSPGAVSQRRRNIWQHRQAVFEHFHAKKAFAGWDPRALHDYIDHGTFDAVDLAKSAADHVVGNEVDAAAIPRTLSFDREVETAIYNTLPHNFSALLKRHPLKCPVAFIGGRQSSELKRAGFAMTKRVTQGRIAMIDGTHLFPMEKPEETAVLVASALDTLSDSDGAKR
ncbi:MAG: alpha/beta hydrolase [Burkholderiales bacterium]